MINRYVTRTVLNSTEVTSKTRSLDGSEQTFELTTADSFYLVFKGKITARYFKMGTVNSNSITISVDTWDGSAWQSVEDLVDETEGFTKDGFIHWQNRNDWKTLEQAPLSDREDLYWARIQVSGDLSVGTTLEACINLFSNDDDLAVYYPELISDTSFLPSGQTSFIKQHEMAKEYVVQKLKERKLIDDESQIIDYNAVNVAAIHATAYLILAPIATSEAMIDLANRAKSSRDDELDTLRLNVDTDKDGISEDHERIEIAVPVGIFRR